MNFIKKMMIGFIGFLEKKIIDFYINLCYNIIKKEKERKIIYDIISNYYKRSFRNPWDLHWIMASK